MKGSFKQKPMFPRHCSDELLLANLDGELATALESKVRAHLKTCWKCRARATELEEVAQALARLQGDQILPSPQRVAEAEHRYLDWKAEIERGFVPIPLSRPHSEPSRHEKRAGVSSALRSWIQGQRLFHSVKWAGGLAVLLALVFSWMHFNSVQVVSAHEVLERAKSAEAEEIRQAGQPVIYQKLRVRRRVASPGREDFVSWEIWSDPEHRQVRQRVEDETGARWIGRQEGLAPGSHFAPAVSAPPPVLEELAQILEFNRMDPARPLSPASYQAWRQSIQLESENVTQTELAGGAAAFQIQMAAKGPFDTNAIIRADSLVRQAGWHVVQQVLRVQRNNSALEYELSETSYDVLELSALSPSIFEDLARLTPPAPPLTAPKAPALKAKLATDAELLAAEIQARYLLHRAKACLGDPIQITREGREWIAVRGLAKSATQKAELLFALEAVPLVKVEIQTVEEAMRATAAESRSQPGRSQSRDDTASEPASQFQNTRLPIEEIVDKGSATPSNLAGRAEESSAAAELRQRLARVSNEAVSLSKAALDEAWALRRLAEFCPLTQRVPLQAPARWLIEGMVQDHCEKLREKTNGLQALLEPLSPSVVAETSNSASQSAQVFGQPPEGSGWSAQGLHLFRVVEQMDRLTQGLFAGAGMPGQPARQATQTLLAAFPHLEEGFRGLQAELDRESLGGPDLLSSKDQRK